MDWGIDHFSFSFQLFPYIYSTHLECWNGVLNKGSLISKKGRQMKINNYKIWIEFLKRIYVPHFKSVWSYLTDKERGQWEDLRKELRKLKKERLNERL